MTKAYKVYWGREIGRTFQEENSMDKDIFIHCKIPWNIWDVILYVRIEGIKVRQVGRIEIKQGLTGHAAGIRFNLIGQVIGKPMKNFDLES